MAGLEKFHEYLAEIVEEKPGKYSHKNLIKMIQNYSKKEHKQKIQKHQASRVIDDLVEQKEIYSKRGHILKFNWFPKYFPI